jgi:5-formyltetrahydrofolate cyclo-ligase
MAAPSRDDEISTAKQAWRERTWRALQESGAARFPGARGRIPNFAGAEIAAERVAELAEWRGAVTVKANPDAPQLPVRARALKEGKLVYMAVPRLAAAHPFLMLDPAALSESPRRAASIRGASRQGTAARLPEVRPIDVVVCGTVVVNSKGIRIGKGGGYSDIEFGLLTEVGAVTDRTVIVTTVHEIQVVDEALPHELHDFAVDVVVTPERVITCPRGRRPAGILWDRLDPSKIEGIPVLRDLVAARPGTMR